MNVPYPAAKIANPTEQEEEMQWTVQRFHIRPGGCLIGTRRDTAHNNC